MDDIPAKVPDAEIYKLRDQSCIYGDAELMKVRAGTLFEMCVEIELHRHDQAKRQQSK
jgi:hypothetical protein